jgi:predicted SAM-dependent methyltransferase
MANGLKVNLGCGSRTHPDWINIDYSRIHKLKTLWPVRYCFRPSLPRGYINHDLRNGIPLASEAASVAFASHMLEHFDRPVALLFLRDVYRILERGAIFRIVVPDLEAAARSYTEAAQAVRNDAQYALESHEWATINLLDQMVRSKLGGEMAPWLRQHKDSPVVRGMSGIYLDIAASQSPKAPKGIRAMLASLLRSDDPAVTGELHRWMYDEVSLRVALEQAGFADIRRVSYDKSSIPHWSTFGFDCDSRGIPYMPDSLWMEAVK